MEVLITLFCFCAAMPSLDLTPASLRAKAMGKFDALSQDDEGAAAGGSGGKVCSICGESKNEAAFSKKQWAAKAHSRKCTSCVESGAVAPAKLTSGGDDASALDAPPPWYDENCDPEFLGEENLSMVFQDEYKPMLLAMEKGEMDADENLVKPEFRHMVKSAMTGLQSACSMGDIPMMKAVLRCGARIDRFGATGSNMQMLVGMMLMQVLSLMIIHDN